MFRKYKLISSPAIIGVITIRNRFFSFVKISYPIITSILLEQLAESNIAIFKKQFYTLKHFITIVVAKNNSK